MKNAKRNYKSVGRRAGNNNKQPASDPRRQAASLVSVAGPNGGCSIRHRTAAIPVYASTSGPTFQRYVVNLGSTKVFGSFARVFRGYNLARIRSMGVLYKPVCSERVSGRVGVAVTSSANDPDLASISAISGSAYSTTTKASKASTLLLRRDMLVGPRGGFWQIAQSASEASVSDLGSLQVFAEGAINPDRTGTFLAGELTLSFHVDLKEPIGFGDQSRPASDSYSVGTLEQADPGNPTGASSSHQDGTTARRLIGSMQRKIIDGLTAANLEKVMSDFPAYARYFNSFTTADQYGVAKVSRSLTAGTLILPNPYDPGSVDASLGTHNDIRFALAYKTSGGGGVGLAIDGDAELRFYGVYGADETTPDADTYKKCVPALYVLQTVGGSPSWKRIGTKQQLITPHDASHHHETVNGRALGEAIASCKWDVGRNTEPIEDATVQSAGGMEIVQFRIVLFTDSGQWGASVHPDPTSEVMGSYTPSGDETAHEFELGITASVTGPVMDGDIELFDYYEARAD